MDALHILNTTDSDLLHTNVASIAVRDMETNEYKWEDYTVLELISWLVRAKETIISLEGELKRKQEKIDKLHQHFIDNL